MSNDTMRTIRLAGPALVLAASLLPACQLPGDPPTTLPRVKAAAAPETAPPPPYATRARERERSLAAELLPVIERTKAEVALIEERLQGRLAALPRPFRYATREPFLRQLHGARTDAYQRAVAELFGGALAGIDELYARSMDAGTDLARQLSAQRSPLDAGATGEPVLDRQLKAFEQTLRMALDREGLEARGYQQSQRRDDLLEAFTSFTSEGADGQLGGRLMVFVGGDLDERPRCDVVLRTEPGVPASDRGLFHVQRLRVVAGDTVVEDLGWRAVPAGTGLPLVTVEGERYLIAPDLAPVVDTGAEGYEQLHRRRILADMQTAVFDRAGRVLGGVDWRLEYRVSGRGDLTWLPAAAAPAFNPDCAEAVGVRGQLQRAAQAGDGDAAIDPAEGADAQG